MSGRGAAGPFPGMRSTRNPGHRALPLPDRPAIAVLPSPT